MSFPGSLNMGTRLREQSKQYRVFIAYAEALWTGHAIFLRDGPKECQIRLRSRAPAKSEELSNYRQCNKHVNPAFFVL